MVDFFNTLSLLRSFSERKNYVAMHYALLGSGTGRCVYDLENGLVLKLARNKRGIEQNRNEAVIGLDHANHACVAPVTMSHERGYYLVMTKTAKVNEEEFFCQYGSPFEDFLYFLRFQRPWNNAPTIYTEVRRVLHDYQLDHFDLSDKSSWGILNNNPVLIDYGLTLALSRALYNVAY